MRPLTDTEWQDFECRRPRHDGLVVVLTTGIVCRFGCPARTPLRKNTRFAVSADAAVAAGFRPCLRCKPVGTDPKVMAAVHIARAIQEAPDRAWDRAEIGEISGVAGRTAVANFRSVFGCGPRQFRDAARLRLYKSALRAGAPVTVAGYDAGYSGPAQQHQATQELGMTATQFANGANGVRIETVVTDTPLGRMVISATPRGICYLRFVDDEDPLDDLKKEFPQADHYIANTSSEVLDFARQVSDFLGASGPRPDLPVDLYGTAFQLKVWEALQRIPRGQTRTYGQLAEEIGHPKAARAVGSANGRNRVAVLVPCHLVVAGGGKLGGYSGGLDRKRQLLALEQI